MLKNYAKLDQEIYFNDPYFIKIREVFNKWKNENREEMKIASNSKKLSLLSLKDKWEKISDILFESLLQVNFKSKDCFKVYLGIHRLTLKKSALEFKCTKSYLEKSLGVERILLYRILDELVEKNMLIVEKLPKWKFIFTLNKAPLSWNVSEREKEEISKIINREIDRIHKKYILEEDICDDIVEL